MKVQIPPFQDRFLIGKELFNASQGHVSSQVLIFQGKTFCTPPDTTVVAEAFKNFADCLQYEHTLIESRVAHGHIVPGPLVEITKLSGKFFRKQGFSQRGGKHFLYPEEAVYLAEKGMVQVYDRGLPLSMQQLCNALFTDSYTHACYSVYARLVRQGFVVRRREDPRVFVDTVKHENLVPRERTLFVDPSNVIKTQQRSCVSERDLKYSIACPAEITPIFAENLENCINTCATKNRGAVELPKILYNVYDERNVEDKKRFSKKTASPPTFVLIVVNLEDGDPYLIVNRQLLTDAGLPPATKVVLATIDNGDIYFQSQESFSIPRIKYI